MISFLLWTQGKSFLLTLNKKKKEQGCAKDTKITGFQKDKVRCRIDHRGQFSDFLPPIARGNLDSHRKALPSTELSVLTKLR